ncbi:MAG: UMP kinase [Nanoarchaeota archaeon]|nr:UMP kinase [Nanoarchaeota archaeon]MBU1321878.1 UMP kinase [Nanoarchaeota archaeon]MBU1597653.1 UMP kinase [Nanoarchaeota archaeon]MBU2442216.1 UMP kinase [Nanoarchaeota archaeon]
MTETIVISVGGSLICPDNIDVDFLKKFKEIIIKQIAKGKRFVLITGGGRTARNYQAAAREVSDLDDEDLDWIGIHGTRINAHLFRTIFKAEAEPRIVKNPEEDFEFNKSILIGSGWKPGNSTDYIAVLLAKKLDVKKVINLSNIDYVYDRDPAKYSDAHPFIEMTWEEFRGRFGDEWDPGLNSPFDPVASREADKNGMTVYIVNGAKLENLDNILEGKGFVGTTIS